MKGFRRPPHLGREFRLLILHFRVHAVPECYQLDLEALSFHCDDHGRGYANSVFHATISIVSRDVSDLEQFVALAQIQRAHAEETMPFRVGRGQECPRLQTLGADDTPDAPFDYLYTTLTRFSLEYKNTAHARQYTNDVYNGERWHCNDHDLPARILLKQRALPIKVQGGVKHRLNQFNCRLVGGSTFFSA
ncbi:hypothetical protein CPB85DRAFT_479278 [Mucidula mucida]|nr:hypothetical protein CPB85DRAFT_479278 [Mucidula mucida]